MNARSLVIVWSVLLAGGLALPARGGMVEDFNGRPVNIEYWSGLGSNAAILVVDFSSAEGDSYAFGYRWDDGNTFTRAGDSLFATTNPVGSAGLSEAMLLAVQGDGAAGRLQSPYQYHNVFGFNVLSFSYAGHTMLNDWLSTYAAFYISGSPAWQEEVWDQVPPGSGNWQIVSTLNHPAVPGDGVNWQFSGFGASFRTLADGYYDGWSLGDATTFSSLPPATPMPEPASLALLAGGALALSRRRSH